MKQEKDAGKIMNPTFVVASQNVDKDISILREMLEQLQKDTRYQNGYELSDKGTLADGWWFYEIYLTSNFLDRIFNTSFSDGKRIKDDKELMEVIQNKLKTNNSTARIRRYRDKPLFIRWWKWLLK